VLPYVHPLNVADFKGIRARIALSIGRWDSTQPGFGKLAIDDSFSPSAGHEM
jgi:hypothetical protein